MVGTRADSKGTRNCCSAVDNVGCPVYVHPQNLRAAFTTTWKPCPRTAKEGRPRCRRLPPGVATPVLPVRSCLRNFH
eukprot:274477-Pleurochrysis_carterae.AAC.6